MRLRRARPRKAPASVGEREEHGQKVVETAILLARVQPEHRRSDADAVPITKRPPLGQALVVDERPVQRTEVRDPPLGTAVGLLVLAGARNLGVAPRDLRIVERDRAGTFAAEPQDFRVERVLVPSFGPPSTRSFIW